MDCPVTGVSGPTGRRRFDCLRDGVPAAVTELHRLGRTLLQRASHMLAYFHRPGISNGPTEAINGGSNTSTAPP